MSSVKPILGIVGGIGSGKSFVAREFAKHGGYLIDADALGHEALQQDAIKAAVIERFGKGIADEAGTIQRRRLGKLVFADAKELRALEELVFPWIRKRILEEIDKGTRDENVRMVVLDAAVMLEANWFQSCDHIVFVDAAREQRLARLKAQRGWDEKELAAREASQMPLDEKKQRADILIVNASGTESVANQVEELLPFVLESRRS